MIAQNLRDVINNSLSAPNLTGSESFEQLNNTLGSVMINSVKEAYKKITCNVTVAYLGDDPADKEKKPEVTSVRFTLKYTPQEGNKDKSLFIRNLHKLLSGIRGYVEKETYQNMLQKGESDEEAKLKSHIRSFSFIVLPDKTFRIENIKYYE